MNSEDSTKQEEAAKTEMQRIWDRPKAEEDANLQRVLGEKERPALRIGRQSSKVFIEAGSPRLLLTATQAREIASVLVQYATEAETRNK